MSIYSFTLSFCPSFSAKQSRNPVLAYAVELTGVQDWKITGNLYELDYEKHYERVKDNTVDAGMVTLVYEHGTREQPADRRFDGYPDPQLVKFEYFEVQPKDPEALHNNLFEREARHIVADMKKLPEPNSPDKSHFMVELSPTFTRLASTKGAEHLFSVLSYKSLSFSAIKNQHGTYVLIGKDENRDREVRKPRPSVQAQLAREKREPPRKKAKPSAGR